MTTAAPGIGQSRVPGTARTTYDVSSREAAAKLYFFRSPGRHFGSIVRIFCAAWFPELFSGAWFVFRAFLQCNVWEAYLGSTPCTEVSSPVENRFFFYCSCEKQRQRQ